jgi:Ca-activated chloride channel family protein
VINLRSAGLILLLLVVINCSAMGQQTSGEDSTVRVVVTVTDSSGRPLTGLTQQQFSVSDKKTPLDITYFDSEDKPVSVAFIFDLSASTSLASRKTAAQIASQIIRGSNSADDYAVIGLRDTPQILCELGCSESEIAAAWQQITGAEIKDAKKTPLYDACELALKKLETSKNSKRAVIVFSDGADSSSKLSLNKLRDALKESGVILYAIVQQKETGLYGGSSMQGGGILEELGVVSGGKAYFPLDAKEIPQIANVIALQLRQQYTIGFKPAEQAPDNKWHSIKIKLTMPKADKSSAPNVRYREGYYSH